MQGSALTQCAGISAVPGPKIKSHSRVLGLWLPVLAPALSPPKDQKPWDAIVAGSYELQETPRPTEPIHTLFKADVVLKLTRPVRPLQIQPCIRQARSAAGTSLKIKRASSLLLSRASTGAGSMKRRLRGKKGTHLTRHRRTQAARPHTRSHFTENENSTVQQSPSEFRSQMYSVKYSSFDGNK